MDVKKRYIWSDRETEHFIRLIIDMEMTNMLDSKRYARVRFRTAERRERARPPIGNSNVTASATAGRGTVSLRDGAVGRG